MRYINIPNYVHASKNTDYYLKLYLTMQANLQSSDANNSAKNVKHKY